MEEQGKEKMIREISKCEERLFTCPYCDGGGLVGLGWYPNKGAIVYTDSKRECSKCKGTGKLKSKVEGKLKIEIVKLPLFPLFIIKEKIDVLHKEGGPANVGTVTRINWGKINIERSENFSKMSRMLDEKHLSKKYLKFTNQKNTEPRISFDILLSKPVVKW
ncbi:MAG: hypothetical protein IB616_03930 [Methanosarcinales archaeon]|nr:MAG: hypothetical protein IB616_03930 [Methanosarcinales archaeon]